ncbi:predicted protein [Aspergillus terreus NIH2624]|uniref:Uncharacterized protein n=1 Tax=Aspergillus terreus (strain NIH 2624 / FGSC A1156) TaxID=341663 RepID=Q0CUQ3_ASPTN|nr:uncharacterized protein ATEG_02581 [Aspergillus terreus NIH2624]EAU37543.1 predicted protein [Aspergillus terreus NIH2624]
MAFNMNMFPLSPADVPRSQDGDITAPIDIPFDEDGRHYPLTDEKAREVAEAQFQKLEELMDNFTRGFDPGNFSREVMSLIPMLAERATPGSFKHLLVLLLENWPKMQSIQASLEDWLRGHYQRWAITHPSDTSITDEMYFGSEIEMLRKLLAPLRGEDTGKVFWMNTRLPDCAKVCKQLEASAKVIEEFKRDILASIESRGEDRTIYNSLPVSHERTVMISMRQLRLDACKATLSWDGFRQSDIELTRFYQFYKEYVSTYQPAKARASGWLPPNTPQVPHISVNVPREDDLVSWPPAYRQNASLDLLLKTALWLSVARGLAAVHLFCDVARMFTIHKPPQGARDSLISFLLHLTQIRVSADGVQSRLASPFPYRDEKLAEYNPDYFDDVWKSNRNLTEGLVENLSLLDKNNPENFKLAKAPRGNRLLRKELRSIAQTAVVRGSLAGTWPLKTNIFGRIRPKDTFYSESFHPVETEHASSAQSLETTRDLSKRKARDQRDRAV